MSTTTRPSRHTWRSAVVAALLVLAIAPASAQAVVNEPLPTDPPLGPPPMPAMPSADPSMPPPAALIADPIEPGAVCGDWILASDYGGSRPTGSTWWEFQCEYWSPVCTAMACNADSAPSYWRDHFYYEPSSASAVFYGEFWGDWGYGGFIWGSGCSYWWDQPTTRWYQFDTAECPYPGANDPPHVTIATSCRGATCTFYAGGYDPDGWIAAYSWEFGDGATGSGDVATHSYAAAGTYLVTLTVTDNESATASATTEVTVAANAAPTARFDISCRALACTVNGAASSDADGGITAYSWDWGDGTHGTAAYASHDWATPGTYTVTLTVTDDARATATATKQVTLLALTARGYKVRSLRYADLAWTGSSGTIYDVFRDYRLLARVAGTTYTDALGRTPLEVYGYVVCTTDGTICSNYASVSF